MIEAEPMTRPNPFAQRWRAHVPTREAMEANRWLRPVAHLVLRPELWRFHRRSVPRGVALGTFVGVAIPVGHSPLAAFLAVFVDANVPVAFGTTWVVSNPLTLGPLVWGGWRIGRVLLHMDMVPAALPAAAGAGDPAAVHGAVHAGVHAHHMLHHLAGMGMAAVYGLFVEATVLAALAYVLSSFGWRWRVRHRRRMRLRHRAQAARPA